MTDKLTMIPSKDREGIPDKLERERLASRQHILNLFSSLNNQSLDLDRLVSITTVLLEKIVNYNDSHTISEADITVIIPAVRNSVNFKNFSFSLDLLERPSLSSFSLLVVNKDGGHYPLSRESVRDSFNEIERREM